MSYELVNGFELWPHRPDWATAPSMSFRWETKVASALDGSEYRSAIRNRVRRGVRFMCRSFDLTESNKMRARLVEIDKVGTAACPLWGRGLKIVSASGTTVTLEAAPAVPPVVGDFVFLGDWRPTEWATYDVREVQAVSGATITLTASLDNSYAAGNFLYPVLFGPFTHGPLVAHSNWTCSVDCEIIESQTNPTPMDSYMTVSSMRLITIGQDELLKPTEVQMLRVIVIGQDNLPAVESGAPAWV